MSENENVIFYLQKTNPNKYVCQHLTDISFDNAKSLTKVSRFVSFYKHKKVMAKS